MGAGRATRGNSICTHVHCHFTRWHRHHIPDHRGVPPCPGGLGACLQRPSVGYGRCLHAVRWPDPRQHASRRPSDHLNGNRPPASLGSTDGFTSPDPSNQRGHPGRHHRNRVSIGSATILDDSFSRLSGPPITPLHEVEAHVIADRSMPWRVSPALGRTCEQPLPHRTRHPNSGVDCLPNPL